MNKKLSAVLALLLVAAMSLSACGAPADKSSAAAPAAPADSSSAAAPAADAAASTERQTGADKKVVTVGTFDKACDSPVFVTSVGQSADVSMLDALMKKVGAEYTFNSTATATDIAAAKTVIIACGASSKGLGAAGISADDEKHAPQSSSRPARITA